MTINKDSDPLENFTKEQLANLGKSIEALDEDEKKWNQQNGWSTFGLYQALEAQGKDQEALVIKRQFESFWRNADVELTRSRI